MRGLADLRRLLLLAAVVALAAFVVACGDDDSSGGGDGDVAKGEGIRAGSGSRAEKAAAAGEQAAKEAGKPVSLETKTIGIINFLNGIESSDRLASTTKEAAKAVGWKTIQCDGKGTPTQFVACGNSLLDRGVDGIVEIAIDPTQIAPVLKKANAQNIPVVQVGGGALPNGDLDGNYGPDEPRAGQILADALLKKLDTLPEDKVPMAIHDFPAAWAADRTKSLRTTLQGQDKVEIAADTTTDAAALVPFTRKTVADQITANPDLKAFWMTFDTTGQVGGQVVTSKYPGKEFPDKPLVVTFHADLGTLDLMRQGNIDMTSEVNYDAAVWIGIDQMAGFFARDTEISKENQPTYPVVGDLFTYKIVEKDDLPPKGEYVEPEWDVPAYFQAKWKAEFNAN